LILVFTHKRAYVLKLLHSSIRGMDQSMGLLRFIL
jgi:hypothetical protein